MFSHSKSSGCDILYDISHWNTILDLSRSLILGVNCDYFEDSSGLYEEFLNLGEHMESECSTNWNYKLVAVIKEVINGGHVMAYVRASTYVNQTGNTKGIHDENGLLRMDDEVIK